MRRTRAANSAAAERMRRYRARQRAAGLLEKRAWTAGAGSAQVYSDHRVHEIRSLALHALIARKLERDPALLKIAKRNLKRWRATHPEVTAFREWEHILRRPLPEILSFITASTAEAERLRQSTPFAGVLAQAERERVFAALRP